ncbi:ATP-binding cassette domain-containing protein [Lachnospira pectinoschiza]|uniref:ABC-2 type transport system ATP-binding protein n=1 Tax=Lachnospira pectinoschiza TaxID=28052 RepID=A0A1G9U1M5_9FIRM|nr:ABC transporter ATP-binding protein [Lachnospira pectinoschiza]SDM53782.1 ABC-2 type transport system ATP-binding protein [Lachnospira pectinoschiza]
MIEIRDLKKKLGSMELNMSLTIPEGYICGLIGRNGSGKTSLLNLITGLMSPDEGKVVIDGLEYDKDNKGIYSRIALVSEDGLLDELCSARENGLLYGRYYTGFNMTSFLCLLNKYRVNPNIAIDKLSRGEKLKVQFAFAISTRPKYLILDEPSANFDPEFKKAFHEEINKLMSDGKHTVIFATHITSEIDRLGDYLLFIHEGKKVFMGDLESFRDKYKLAVGEEFYIDRLTKEALLSKEVNNYSTRAMFDMDLINIDLDERYMNHLEFSPATIEDFMYFYTKEAN